ncbi:MAG: 3-deoxy-D-arabino-heptulosonate 7-phosphate synthase [Opitutae bacterium]|nr:3-deoxy-D-arabino-heptulosonate 7-phosphate synthase [Opitutae bacterium]MEC7542463.1 3-deoxy-D-arabino-heptulosonate 7-phosphate synthase [Verrucomicrobiota bacterium]MED5279935.1 3-deoxy-D-arabino-heptulosonate 7-phosphate synthase [Verrucomicrobiota bacterium]|tara:strand:- start:1385 stop:2425 length:1041 start_codon:yes stop_codon:yes gene_type:complete
MIIPKGNRLSQDQLKEVERVAADFDCSILEIHGRNRCVYAILGDETHAVMFKRIAGLSFIRKVDMIESSYKLMDRRSGLADHIVRMGKTEVGVDAPYIIGGPCTIDPANPSLYLETAHALKEAGVNALRGGVWKPRTNPYSYQGDDNALSIILQAREETGLPIDVEVMDSEQLRLALEAQVDVLQVGTRNALNYSLLKQIGRESAETNSAVLLKRGRHVASPDEFIAAAEYIVAEGNPDVMLCPRGTTPALDGYRNHPDESVTPLLKNKTWAPVVVDPSHSVGHSDYVLACSLAAVAYGADGLCIESHVDPQRGIGDDPKQAITPEKMKDLIRACQNAFPNRYKIE